MLTLNESDLCSIGVECIIRHDLFKFLYFHLTPFCRDDLSVLWVTSSVKVAQGLLLVQSRSAVIVPRCIVQSLQSTVGFVLVILVVVFGLP